MSEYEGAVTRSTNDTFFITYKRDRDPVDIIYTPTDPEHVKQLHEALRNQRFIRVEVDGNRVRFLGFAD